MNELTGRIALVTGAAQAEGIGQGIVRSLLEAGATVIYSDINDEAAREAQAGLDADHAPGRAAYLHQDVASAEDWAAVHDEIIRRHGGLDILVNNAGSSFAGSLTTLEVEDLRRCLSVNFESQFLGLKVFRESLIERAALWAGGTSVINNSSIGAYMSDASNLPYAVSKSAARMLTMRTAQELAPYNVRVNSMHVGMIDTPLLRASFDRRVGLGQGSDVETLRQGLEARVPLGRIGTPTDAGELAAFLASDSAKYVTAAAFICDGGMTARF